MAWKVEWTPSVTDAPQHQLFKNFGRWMGGWKTKQVQETAQRSPKFCNKFEQKREKC